MLSVLAIVLPIFALILTGWLARKTGALGPRAMGEINRFVVYLALPTLLFDIVANADWESLWQPGFVGAFGLSALIVFIIGLLLSRSSGRHLADAAIDGLNAAYANNGFIGIPLALAVLGPASLIPTMISMILTVCVIFGIAIVVVEFGLQPKAHPGRMLLKIGGQLCRNPLLVAPMLGAVVMLLGMPVPTPVESFLKLLGGAASPCALIALGLFLAQPRSSSQGTLQGLSSLVLLKLVAHPCIAWVLAALVFKLPLPLQHCAVLLAALPTGTGPFMLAQYYRRPGGMTSASILISTLLSLLTITVYLMIALPG